MTRLWSRHAAVPGVPRWARTAATAIPLLVLPAGLWRIATVTFHLPLDRGDTGGGELPSWLPVEVYVVLLSLVSEALAATAYGLVCRWGEVVPRWVPLLGGRRVPPLAAIVPASLGAAALTTLWTAAAVTIALGHTLTGGPEPATSPFAQHDWRALLTAVTYAPLLLWGPLLGALTIAYARRRLVPAPVPRDA